MRDQRILLTGATGIVGCELVRELLRRPEPPEIFALMRGSEEEIRVKRRWLCVWAGVPPERAKRLTAVHGDIRLAGLGLSEKDCPAVRSVTGILHAGAVTSFDQTREAARLNNVDSTINILGHARRCTQVERIGVVSSAYVAGRRAGTIREEDLDLDADFNNEYERSKAIAEHHARIAMHELPVDIYRLSIVVGRRTDGHISRLSGIYPIFRLFHEGLLAMFPGNQGQTVDLIPSDFAASAIHYLFARSCASGTTYHICAGGERSFGLDEIFPAIDSFLVGTDAAWRGRGQPLPLPVAPEIFQGFVDIVEMTGNRRLRQIIRQTRKITQQLEVAKVFDTLALDRAIDGNPALALPHAREWLRQIVARGVETGWQQPSREGAK
jgi:nucleoside-diphosphate-sugar epimerase